MKTLTLLFLLSFLPFLNAQDTLFCKKDLLINTKQDYYYKKDDPTKTPYTGPAKCSPKKGMMNYGRLKNGVWDGKITGYKEGKVIGFVHYKEGKYHGLELRYDAVGRVIDSCIFQEGKLTFREESTYSETNLKSKIITTISQDTLSRKYVFYQDGELESANTEQFVGKRKVGVWQRFFAEYDEQNNLVLKLEDSKRYGSTGKVIERDFYDGGFLYKREFYEENGKVKLELSLDGSIDKLMEERPFLNGKIHGEVKYYNNGKLYQLEVYEKGRLVETKEINP